MLTVMCHLRASLKFSTTIKFSELCYIKLVLNMFQILDISDLEFTDLEPLIQNFYISAHYLLCPSLFQ